MQNPEIESYLNNAREEVILVKALLGMNPLRIAISRCYYAMFYLAKAFLVSENLDHYTKHSAVKSAFGQYFANTGKVPKQFHHYLRDNEKDRLISDYEFNMPVCTK